MSYAYLVVTMDVSANPPRVLRSGVFATSGKVIPPQPGRFHFDVMCASGRTFDEAKTHLFHMSKRQEYEPHTAWAFRLLPTDEFALWAAAKVP